MATPKEPHRVLIVGGGFGGVEAAKTLKKLLGSSVHVTVVDPKSYLEYPAALYRFAVGHDAREVCLPYRDIFKGCDVEVVKDTIDHIDIPTKTASGESKSHYHFDSLIIAVGSQESHFNIPGVEELSFGMKTANQAIILREHIQKVFEDAASQSKDVQVSAGHIVVVGGGASGVEIAAELVGYAKKLAARKGINQNFVTIDLIEGKSQILPNMDAKVGEKVRARLQHLGVNIFLNRSVVKEEAETLHLKDMHLTAKTVVWTAGLTVNALLKTIDDLPMDAKGRAEVTNHLETRLDSDVYAIGDCAATAYSGMAQTAQDDGHFVAQVIAGKLLKKKVASYKPKKPIYAVPVGPSWAVVVFQHKTVYGFSGWVLRRAADFKVFLSLLPWAKAVSAFIAGSRRPQE